MARKSPADVMFDSADAEGTAGAAGSGTTLPEAGAVHVHVRCAAEVTDGCGTGLDYIWESPLSCFLLQKHRE